MMPDEIAERDQYKAVAANWAREVQINFDALIDRGFTRQEATALLAAQLSKPAPQQTEQLVDLLQRMVGDDESP